jgi:enoyl-CoA hydratase/carnithine racemase
MIKEWNTTPPSQQGKLPPMGFGGLSFRHGRKPVIAAVNGIALGGGCEMVISCDMVIASKNATLALPDTKVGLTLLGGCLPRLVRTIGRQRATDMCLTGRPIKAEEAREWGLVSQVVESEELMRTALGVARSIAANSPDALIATREGILMGLGAGGAEEVGLEFVSTWRGRLVEGENLAEGIKAFRERRKPNWKPSRL